MSALVPTRRAVFGAIALAPVVLVAPSVAAAPANQGVVEQAWTEWRKGMRSLDVASNGEIGDAESAIWKPIKRSGKIIETSLEKGPRVAEIRLWFSISYDMIYTEEVEALHREDVDWLIANAKDPEYSTKMALLAIKALRS